MKSKINFVIQIITLCLLLSVNILPQDNQQDHYLLAKNFILKNSLETQRSFILPNVAVDTDKWTKEIEDILHSDKLEYTIRTINKIKSYESFLLTDKTNFRLHNYYSQFYVYNTDNRYYGYDEIDSHNILKYINDNVLDYATVDDYNKIIDLYNEVYFFPMNTIYDSVIFFDTNNIDEFTDLKGIARFDELMKFLNFNKIISQNRVYKKCLGNDFIEYYLISYFFKNHTFSIEQNLLSRLRVN
jgi:hypothetical protein